MKKSAIACLLMIVLVFSFGCKKDDSSTPSSGLSVKIDGTVWTGQVNTAYYQSQQNVTIITGANTTLTEQLQVAFLGNSTGTYTFKANDIVSYGTFAYLTNLDLYTTYYISSPVGEIIVTEYDKTNHVISGTFHFEAYNSNDKKMVLTDGKFTNLKYEDQ
jgi:hypothetical protein